MARSWGLHTLRGNDNSMTNIHPSRCIPKQQFARLKTKCQPQTLCLGSFAVHSAVSQRSLHNAPIFRLLLKVAVNGTHQCDFPNFCGHHCPTYASDPIFASESVGGSGWKLRIRPSILLLCRSAGGIESLHVPMPVGIYFPSSGASPCQKLA